MENPYQSPNIPAAGGEGLLPLPPRARVWAVGQVRMVALLMAVQGALETGLGLISLMMAILMPAALADPRFRARMQPGEENFMWFAAAFYGGVALACLIAAGLHFYAAYRNYYFKGHTLGIVALGSSVVHLLIFCCAPTGIALAIYGLIVYLDPDVAHAFRLVESGHSVETVQANYS